MLPGEAVLWLEWSDTAVVEGAVVLVRAGRAELEERDESALGFESSAVMSEERSRRVRVCDGAVPMDDAAVLMTMRWCLINAGSRMDDDRSNSSNRVMRVGLCRVKEPAGQSSL